MRNGKERILCVTDDNTGGKVWAFPSPIISKVRREPVAAYADTGTFTQDKPEEARRPPSNCTCDNRFDRSGCTAGGQTCAPRAVVCSAGRRGGGR